MGVTGRAARSPVGQFVVAGLVAVVLVSASTLWFSARAAERVAIDDAEQLTRVLARSVAEPAIPPGLLTGDVGAADRFDRYVAPRLVVGDVRRVKIWSRDGTVVYSDEGRLIGERFPLGRAERAILARGGIEAEVSDLSRPENRFERGGPGLLEVYTRIHGPGGVPLLFEAYFSEQTIARHRTDILGSFRPITFVALVLLLLALTPPVWWVTRRLRRASRDRERLLRVAVDASDAERRRIARDLHDTVVQDLAGTSFALSAAAQSGEPDRHELAELGDGVRSSLRSLRSLMVEIYPPDLHERGIEGALADLLASTADRIEVADVEVQPGIALSEEDAALAWRVAQEAVRNAVRHSGADTLLVSLTARNGEVRLVVADDGRGFDDRSAPGPGHVGLRGLRDLVAETGGRLEVATAPGLGTRVELVLGGRR